VYVAVWSRFAQCGLRHARWFMPALTFGRQAHPSLATCPECVTERKRGN